MMKAKLSRSLALSGQVVYGGVLTGVREGRMREQTYCRTRYSTDETTNLPSDVLTP
jgi:hypothetical protein